MGSIRLPTSSAAATGQGPAMPGLRQIRLATGLVPPRASGGRRSEWTGSKASSLRLLPLANRSLMNRDALVSAQPTRLAEDRFSRFSPAHRADFEGRQRADSAPTRVASGRTGACAIAVVPLGARNRLHHRSKNSDARERLTFSGATARLRGGVSSPDCCGRELWRDAQGRARFR
jgi:hypothetical protein